MQKRKKIATIVLAIITIGWLVLMWRLSSADGMQTVADSMGITQKLANLFWENPTATQIADLHMAVRKAAHIVLYFIFGIFLWLFWDMALAERCRRRARGYGYLLLPSFIAGGMAIILAFADELHKIPIDGRHFSLSELILNAVCALIPIIIGEIILIIRERKRRVRE